MKFNVPQFIDIEDKIAFQLTAKQLGWFALGGVLVFFAWTLFSQGAFIAWTIVIIVFVGSFAFYRPTGITLTAFLKFGFFHLLRPKMFIWRVEYQKNREAEVKKKAGKLAKTQAKKELAEDLWQDRGRWEKQ